MQAIWQNDRIGDPVYDGLTLGGLFVGATLDKEDYPGLRAIRLPDGTVILAVDLATPYAVPATAPTDIAFGLLAVAQRNAAQTGIGTSQTDLTGLAVTFTAVSGRRYRATMSLQFTRSGSGTPAYAIAQLKDTSGSPIHQDMVVETPSTGYSLTVERSRILACPTDFAAGSRTVKLSAAAAPGAGNTVDMSATANRYAFISIEDIGPVTPAVATTGPVELWY